MQQKKSKRLVLGEAAMRFLASGKHLGLRPTAMAESCFFFRFFYSIFWGVGGDGGGRAILHNRMNIAKEEEEKKNTIRAKKKARQKERIKSGRTKTTMYITADNYGVQRGRVC